MEIKTVEDCFKFRLLRKINSDIEKSKKSFEIAQLRLKEAQNTLKLKIYRYVVMESYTAMFHASKALLYKDGVQEKSHFAVYIYLKEKYSDKIPINVINFLNVHRIERHEAFYGLEYQPQEEDALMALKDAESFIQEIGKLLNFVLK
jgi:uncharacterized protein (UPF0332 family)